MSTMLFMYTFTGSDFEITASYKTVKGTGTGEIQLLIRTQDGLPLGQSNLIDPQDPGSYTVKWDGSAKPDPNCDPTQGPCETWAPGNYSVEVGKSYSMINKPLDHWHNSESMDRCMCTLPYIIG